MLASLLKRKEKLIENPFFPFEFNREKTDPSTNKRNPSTRTNHLNSAHGALVHGVVGRDLAALCEEDAGGFRDGAVGDGVEVACADSDGMFSIEIHEIGVEGKAGVAMGYMGVAGVVLEIVVRRLFINAWNVCSILGMGMHSLR